MKLLAFALGLALSVSWQGFASDVSEEEKAEREKVAAMVRKIPNEMWSVIAGVIGPETEGRENLMKVVLSERLERLYNEAPSLFKSKKTAEAEGNPEAAKRASDFMGTLFNLATVFKIHYPINSIAGLDAFIKNPRPGKMVLNFSGQRELS